jgi:hypothetical protein
MSVPIAIAGNNQTIQPPTSSVILDGSASVGTGGATIAFYSWAYTAGPAGSSIFAFSEAVTAVTGLVVGQYVFTLTVTDSNNVTASSSTIITVNVNGSVYTPAPSNFASFQSDYSSVNWLDTPTWTKKKVYDVNYWLVFPQRKFSIKFQNNKPNLVVFLKTAGEQFGDAITPLNILDYTVTFKCYDLNDELIIRAAAQITNASIGQIEYQFQDLDFYYKGTFYGEFDFTDADGNTFTLPDSTSRIQIIVY